MIAMHRRNIHSSKCRCLRGAMLILFVAVQFCLSGVFSAANIAFKFPGSCLSMQDVAGFMVGNKATLLCKIFVTMGARTSPLLMLLLVLIEMTLGVTGFWTLVTPVPFCSFFMSGLPQQHDHTYCIRIYCLSYAAL